MAHVTKFSPKSTGASNERLPSDSQEVADQIRALLENVPQESREAILAAISEYVRPIPVERAGDVLGTVVRFVQRKQEVTVEDVKEAVREAGLDATPKEVYNAIGYLTRKGHMRRVGYGRYIIDGVEFVTSDDFGGAPSRHEDGYKIDESGQ
ncbi:hypothetical protein EFR00_30265 [Rhizobium sophoriradicis]|uniref:hypothetical protein n=1 Tax=Rhizobium sophoriradicis TaxID=1535245 RepID=UPI00098EC535|nr:hypothetical protein [Rhizobium sophoriradicis]RSB82436.1 hypothetical protein EFR00_30265 [Rhizobium sophoriradicis]